VLHSLDQERPRRACLIVEDMDDVGLFKSTVIDKGLTREPSTVRGERRKVKEGKALGSVRLRSHCSLLFEFRRHRAACMSRRGRGRDRAIHRLRFNVVSGRRVARRQVGPNRRLPHENDFARRNRSKMRTPLMLEREGSMIALSVMTLARRRPHEASWPSVRRGSPPTLAHPIVRAAQRDRADYVRAEVKTHGRRSVHAGRSYRATCP
jgi:hypothetical protein